MRRLAGAFWLTLAVIVFTISVIGSALAPPCDPYQPRSWLVREDWFCRCDPDATAALRQVSFDVTALAARDDRLIVGGRGLELLCSDASGAEWTRPRLRHGPDTDEEAAAGDTFIAIQAGLKSGTALTRDGRVYETLDPCEVWVQDVRFDRALEPLRPLTSASIAPDGGPMTFVGGDRAVYVVGAQGVRQVRPPAVLAYLPSPQTVIVPVNGDVLVGSNAHPLEPPPHVLFATRTTVWAAADDPEHLFRSRNGGTTWGRIHVPTKVSLHALAFDASTGKGWAAGSDGVILRGSRFGDHWVHHTREPVTVRPRQRTPQLPLSFFPGLLLTTGLLVVALRSRSGRLRRRTFGVAEEIASDNPVRTPSQDKIRFDAIARAVARLLDSEDTEPPLTIAVDGPWGSGKSSLVELIDRFLPKSGFRVIRFNAWHHQQEEHILASLLKTIQTDVVPAWWQVSNLSFRLRLAFRRVFRVMRRPQFGLFVLLTVLVGLNVWMWWDRLPRDYAFDPWVLGGLWSAAGTISAVGTFGAAYSILRPFRAQAREVVQRTANLGSSRSLDAHLGFRSRFAEEFRDVTSSLRQRVVVIIDDLDRCSATSVVQVLETINFLTTVGACYFVLALDLETIRGHLNKQANNDAAYGEKYLEKLVNIAIALPKPSPDQAIDIMLPKSIPAWRPQRAHWVAAAVLAATLLLALGMVMRPPPPFHAAPKPAEATETMPTRGPVPAPEVTRSSREPVKASAVSPARSGDWTDEIRRRFTGRGLLAWLPVFAGALGLLAVGLRLLLRIERSFRDSDEFRDAMTIWSRVVHGRDSTPRSLKRFTNRVRYLAIRARIEREAKRLSDSLTDPVLVAMAAIEHAVPDLLQPDLPDHLKTDIVEHDAMGAALEAHTMTFEAIPFERAVPAYLRLSLASVRSISVSPGIDRSESSGSSASALRNVIVMMLLLVVVGCGRERDSRPTHPCQSPPFKAAEFEGRHFMGTIDEADEQKVMHLEIKKINRDGEPHLFSYSIMVDKRLGGGERGELWLRQCVIEFGEYRGLIERQRDKPEGIVLRSSYTERWRLYALRVDKQ